jgi:DNA (cytosine-5)-methyltransferase 1
LLTRERPQYEQGNHQLSLVDLFCGCGGMSLGVAEAIRRSGSALRGALAVDFDPIATQVYQRNFLKTRVETCGVEEIFDGVLGAAVTKVEASWRENLGPVDLLIGGPPCQGHSDLNNRSRREDPRNEFYLRMGRAVEVLRPRAVMVENVPAVQHARQGVVQQVQSLVEGLGYRVGAGVLDVSELGVAQARKRHVLLALAPDVPVDPSEVLKQATGRCGRRSVRWAISDLRGLEPKRDFDRPSKASAENQRRMAWFFQSPERRYDLPNAYRPPCHRDKEHSYNSVYGRLHWDKPAQTITTGFTSMGQGRFVHPASPRTLTPHEAARLQSFPDFFDFRVEGQAQRTAWSKLIGNAVPPQLSMAVMRPVVEALVAAIVPARPRLWSQVEAAV